MHPTGRRLKGPFFFYEVEGAGAILGGSPPQKMAIKGGPSKKIREKGGSRKILPLLEGGRGIKFSCLWGVMQPSNDTSKNCTSPAYLVKNERSLRVDNFQGALQQRVKEYSSNCVSDLLQITYKLTATY